MQRETILSVICAGALGATGHHADAALIHYPWTWQRDAWFEDAAALNAIETITFTEHPVALLSTQYQESHGLTVTGSGWVQIASSTSFVLDGRGLRAVASDAVLHFDRPMQALAADFPGSFIAQFYWDDTFLGAEPFTGPGGPGNFSGVILTIPFNRVRLYDVDSVFGIDDLHFVPVAVPGPATGGAAAASGVLHATAPQAPGWTSWRPPPRQGVQGRRQPPSACVRRA
ncbi:MAG: hypothetical protein KF817_03180 [Phycisphaeraceae bacterium]|nr:hypothetical protein [Phycisphaeraceae bacterium]